MTVRRASVVQGVGSHARLHLRAAQLKANVEILQSRLDALGAHPLPPLAYSETYEAAMKRAALDTQEHASLFLVLDLLGRALTTATARLDALEAAAP